MSCVYIQKYLKSQAHIHSEYKQDCNIAISAIDTK